MSGFEAAMLERERRWLDERLREPAIRLDDVRVRDVLPMVNPGPTGMGVSKQRQTVNWRIR